MPRYYFHLTNGQFIEDEDGELLADDKAARLTGVHVLSEMLLMRERTRGVDGQVSLYVERADGVCFLTLQATVQEHGQPRPRP